jgi:hypothetical protein
MREGNLASVRHVTWSRDIGELTWARVPAQLAPASTTGRAVLATVDSGPRALPPTGMGRGAWGRVCGPG